MSLIVYRLLSIVCTITSVVLKVKGGKVKFSPGAVLEIRDVFDLIIDEK